MRPDGPLGRAYYRLPIAVQNAVCTAYGWREARTRFGDTFDERLNWLAETDVWDRRGFASIKTSK